MTANGKHTPEQIQGRITAVEKALNDGMDPTAISVALGIERDGLRKWCREHGRKDLSDAMKYTAGRPLSYLAHGTDGAYQRHLTRGEEPCGRCTRAHAGANVQRRAARKARAGEGAPQILDPTRRDWDLASCLNGEPDDWFPDPGEYEAAHRAKMACFTKCALRDACLQMAMESDKEWSRYGIYGGYTPAERASLKKKMGAVAA